MKRPQLTCTSCGGKRSARSTSGLCFSCAMKARAPEPRHCAACGAKISRYCKSGLCLPCVRKTPEFLAARADGIRRSLEVPGRKEKMARIVARNHAKARIENPKFEQWLHEHGKQLGAMLQTPEMRARTNSPEAKEKMSRGISEARIGWCPPEFREEYRALIRRKRMHSADAKAVIENRMREMRAIKHPCWESVLDHMRRITAVLTLNNGNYRVGIVELTPGQLLERAEQRGYELPRWAA